MELNKIQTRQIGMAILTVVLLLVADQSSKIWIKTHLQLYESIEIFPWFKLYFTENPGMAFGIEIFDTYLLTIFRLVVVAFFGIFIFRLIGKNSFKSGYIVCWALILAGAMGNILDCAFYGVLFDSSYGQVSTFMPEGGGYSTYLSGKVVDMLSFPLIRTEWPSWIPVWGGQEFVFFRPIFNIADSSICVSVFLLLIFYRRSLSASFAKEKDREDNVG